MPTMTIQRIAILKAVQQLTHDSYTRHVSPKQVSEYLQIKSVNVRSSMGKLFHDGYFERPYHGCYRLSEKGRQILTKLGTDVDY